MFGWFKHMQEVTTDLGKAAKILAEQNPHSLKWAQRRFWEFGSRLVDFDLLPDRSSNGFSAAYMYGDDDLVFFDNHYGVTKDVYASQGVSLRLSLQIADGKRRYCDFVATMYIDVQDSEDEGKDITRGHIELRGRYGRAWEIHTHLRCHDQAQYEELCERFYDIFRPEWFEKDEGALVSFIGPAAKTNPRDARDLFRDMTEYFLAKRK